MASKTTDQVGEIYQAAAVEQRERLIAQGVNQERNRIEKWLAQMLCKPYKETGVCDDIYCHVYENLLTELDKENSK
jgi:hypothetical protein